jgi:Protein of unknown function DUF262
MSTPADSLFSDPSVQFLQKLLDDVRKGDIILPRFQRPFVWDKERRIELFDSVRRGIPIGSLMIWETRAVGDDAQVVPKAELGPFKVPAVPDRTPRRYLLDGEQRLMTLYFALYRADPREDDAAAGEEPAAAFEVFFDLDKLVFVTRADLDDGPLPHHFPLRDIFVPRGVLRFQRELEKALETQPSPDPKETIDKKISDFVERSDTIAEAVRRYKIPVTVLSTDDLELAAETFKRVNSQGVSMSEAHMMNAIAWRSSFDLLERFADLRQNIDGHPLWQEGGNLDDDVLLRVAKRLLERDVYDEKVSEIAPKLRDGAILRRVEESMKRCADFLSARGLRNPAHIPNVMQLVVLGRAFDQERNPSGEALDGLEDWLWFTSYTEVFARVVRGSVYGSLEDQALALVRGGRPRAPSRKPLRKPLPRFDFRSTRSRALSWMFAQRMMKHDEGRAADALAEAGSKVLLHLATPPLRTLNVASNAALRVLCPPQDLEALRQAVRDGTIDQEFREAQVLSDAALHELQKKPRDVSNFTTIRETELNELEDKRFREIFDRLFSGSAPLDPSED